MQAAKRIIKMKALAFLALQDEALTQQLLCK